MCGRTGLSPELQHFSPKKLEKSHNLWVKSCRANIMMTFQYAKTFANQHADILNIYIGQREVCQLSVPIEASEPPTPLQAEGFQTLMQQQVILFICQNGRVGKIKHNLQQMKTWRKLPPGGS